MPAKVHSPSLWVNWRCTDEPHTVDVHDHVHHDYEELPKSDVQDSR